MFRALKIQDVLLPCFVILSLLVMLIMVPTPIMDLLLSVNIALSIVIFLTTFFVQKPLDFNIFPTVLLATTLYRLVLNIATTRLIFTQANAGKVIDTFCNFVSGDSMVVGLVIFLIFIVIQFVVITKGATRISEVAARFTLDAMPGRQMTIDADLNAGIIDEKEAKRQRQELIEQSDFFGAMDGAGKFVRGDAIASIIIVFINILGGIFVGVVQKGFSFTEAVQIYTSLTIGDGLVAQVPALLISLATGILVSRSSQSSNLSRLFVRQIFLQPVVLILTAGFLGLLLVTGMPPVPILCLCSGCLGLAYYIHQKDEKERILNEEQEKSRQEKAEREKENTEEEIEKYLIVDPMELQIGVGLIQIADPQHGGNLLERIRKIRKNIASEIGIILPKVRIRDSLNLDENQYRIRIHGESVAMGMIYPNMLLAVDTGLTRGQIQGIQTTEPATGDPAYWIEEKQRPTAEDWGYFVIDSGTIIERHLREVVRNEADELLTRDATRHLINQIREVSPATVDELIPDVLKISQVQRILQLLLRERVSVRQLEAILETLGDYADRITNPVLLAEKVRERLARTLCSQYSDADNAIHVLLLDPETEEIVRQGVQLMENGFTVSLTPQEVDELCRKISEEISKMALLQFPPVLLVNQSIRPAVRELTQATLPNLNVLGFNEITRETRVFSEGQISIGVFAV